LGRIPEDDLLKQKSLQHSRLLPVFVYADLRISC